ncbi:hypothetical protein VZ95_04215 [Elstera litoralis]|uniref:Lipoprotein n=1 Tax=Elstera litoralis TaxID=552518 RepID=A0A0F3IV70_9PROT|nr:hypothetical protein [Elstera litoralis]KJV10532.1 hypothetical protein VZ95_04215 [Elstera litoralis]
MTKKLACLFVGLSLLGACAALEREPSEDELEAAIATKFRDVRALAILLPGLESFVGLIDVQGGRKQGCQATDDVRRSGYRCTVTLDVKTPLTVLHPTLDLRFIKTASGWAVADLP